MNFVIDETYINWDLFTELFSYNKTHERIREFVKAIDPEIKVFMSGEDFYCYTDTKEINVPFVSNPEGDRLICDFIYDRFGVVMDPYLVGCLHEVGHLMTYDEQIDKERSIIYYMLQLNFKEEKWEEYSKMYFSIPCEFEATKWAVEYYLSHKEFCDNFIKEISL